MSGKLIKPRGKSNAYAFFVKNEWRLAKEKGATNFGELNKLASEKWKSLSMADRKPFEIQAAQDLQRFETEKANFLASGGSFKRKSGKGKVNAKDPNAPKRPLSAFFWYSSDERKKLKEQTPTATVGQLAKILGEMWKNEKPEVTSFSQLLSGIMQ